MDILSYLTDLLNTQKEVGVEGLGTFYKKKVPGRYDVANHQFVPPTYSLSFIEEVKDPSILSNFVSEKRNISEESARYYIGLFVEDINRQVAITNEADLDSLGVLTQIEEVLVLKPGTLDLSTEFYGLPSINAQTPDGLALNKNSIAADVDDFQAIDANDLQAIDTNHLQAEHTNDLPLSNIDHLQTIQTDHLPTNDELSSLRSDDKEIDETESAILNESASWKEEIPELSQDLNNFDKNDNQEVFDEITEEKHVRNPEPKIEIETSETLIDEEQDKDYSETESPESIENKEDQVETELKENKEAQDHIETSLPEVPEVKEEQDPIKPEFVDITDNKENRAHIETSLPEVSEAKEEEDQIKLEFSEDNTYKEEQDRKYLESQSPVKRNEPQDPIEDPSITPTLVNTAPLIENKYKESGSKVEHIEADNANIWHFDKEKSNTPANLQDNNLQESKSSGRSFLIGGLLIALIVLAIALAAVYFLKPALFGKETTVTEAIVATDTLETTKPIIDTAIADSSINKNATTNIDTVVKTVPLTDSTQTKELITWEIIGASLTRAEVSEYIRIMKSRGYTAKPVTNMPGKRRIKMSIATFNTEESAKEGRRLLVKKLNNNDLYIYQNKNTQKPL